MILEIDLGNTRAKWRIINPQAEIIVHRGVDKVENWINGDIPPSWLADIQRVRIASVLSATTQIQLVSKLQSALSVSPEIARASSLCAGVRNAYASPESLGVDRWLALIAAYKKCCDQAVLVIDAGTALKIDVADDAGRHIGGYIVPGAELMERALLDGTDRVRYEVTSQLQTTALGVDTRSCVQHGIAAALAGAVLVSIHQCRSMLNRPRLYITGGLGLQLKSNLEAAGIEDIQFEADLVLDGLRWVLP